MPTGREKNQGPGHGKKGEDQDGGSQSGKEVNTIVVAEEF